MPSIRHHMRLSVSVALLGLAIDAAPASALRVVTYNLFQYPTASLAVRQPNFRTALAALDPDVMMCQEINSSAGMDSMLNNVLNVIQPGQWSGDWRNVGSSEGMAVFWKPAKVTVSFVSVLTLNVGPRDVMWCVVRPVGYGSSSEFRMHSQHFKAGQTAADSATRRGECTELRSIMNGLPSTLPWLLMGDSNFYGAFEGGYIRLTESQADNDGRCLDPLTMPGSWHDNSAYRNFVTQSPCLSSCVDPGYSGGGMDDRFDIILSSYNLQDGAGLDIVPGSTTAYGNDGLHFNQDINADFFNNAVGYTVATALRDASDHIPVFVELQVPARVSAPSVLAFGRAIVGGAPTQSYVVANGAAPPADELDYGFVASAGFTAPAGGFTANAGAAGNAHAIGMDASSVGAKAGTLTLTTDDPDSLTKVVAVSGTVVRHAVPSLDSAAVVIAASADFGDQAIGQFSDLDVRAHNQAYDALQAGLSLDAATITGGDGRFSIVGGFTPSLLTDVGRTFTLRFDSYGATLDSTYDATLVVDTSDEPLEGATPLGSLTVTLRARPVSGVLSTGDPTRVSRLAFHPARPNPLRQETTFAFDLPEPAGVSLEIFDLNGRRIASLASGERPAGRHQVTWGAAGGDGGRVAGGLYFARFTTKGLTSIERVIVLP